MSKSLIVGRVFTHYKNGERYQIRDFAVNPNTQEQIVVYVHLIGKREDGQLWWRPITEFREKFK